MKDVNRVSRNGLASKALQTPPTLDDLPPPPKGFLGWPWTEAPPVLNFDHACDWPIIGIVTPSYNQGRYIEAAVRSVLLQGYPNLLYQVVDGGSDDESLDVLHKYEMWITGWYTGPDQGQSDAINRGMDALEFDLGSWLNSDDLLQPAALLAVGAYVIEHPSCDFLTGHGLYTESDGRTPRFRKRSEAYSFNELLDYGGGKYLPQPSVFFSRELFKRIGGVSKNLHYAMDLDLWLRMRTRTTLHCLNYQLSVLRQHNNSKTLRDNARAMQEVTDVIRQHGVGCPMAVMLPALSHMRKLKARGQCHRALEAYFGGCRTEAWRGLWKASREYPPIIFTRGFAQVLLRAMLPHVIKRKFLARP